jgi:hypothetical protein
MISNGLKQPVSDRALISNGLYWFVTARFNLCNRLYLTSRRLREDRYQKSTLVTGVAEANPGVGQPRLSVTGAK